MIFITGESVSPRPARAGAHAVPRARSASPGGSSWPRWRWLTMWSFTSSYTPYSIITPNNVGPGSEQSCPILRNIAGGFGKMEGNYWCKSKEEVRVNDLAIPNRSAASQRTSRSRFIFHPLVPLVEYFRWSSLLLQGHVFISWYTEKRFATTGSFSVKLLLPIQERDHYHGI